MNNRREELRQKSKRFYWRHKQTNNRQSDDEAEEQSTSQLKVKLPILKKDRFRKTYRGSLRKVYRRNEELKEKNEKLTEKCDDLRKKNKTLHKRIERINKTQKKKLMKSTDDDAVVSNMDTEESFIQLTPRSKTKKQVQELGLDRKRASAVRKRLLLSNTILHCLKPKITMKKEEQVTL